MNFMQPQDGDGDCCCNGVDGSSCTPQAWANACSIGWYLTDRCELDILFRIKKDGVVIVGPSTAHSYSMTPDNDEVADYSVEYCVGPEPCTWIVVWEAEVDTTVEDACPMGIYGQTYVVGLRQSDNTVLPSGTYIYCQSSLVVRVSAACFSFGQKITHLWIDDTLFTPNTSSAGGIATESFDEPLSYSFMCHSGRDYAHTDTPWNDTTLPQIRIPLPIAFTKSTCSVRARQTNGMIIGCTVDFTCTAHYNAASVTLPAWEGMSSTCSASSSAPFGWGSTSEPTPVRYWGQNFETSISIVPDASGGTFAWYTCDDGTVRSMVAITCACTYNFKLSGLVKWVNSADTPPRTIYSGAFDYDHTVTWTMKLVLFASYSPGALTVDSLIAVVDSDAVSTFTGFDDYLDLAINSVPSGWSDEYNGTYGGTIYQGTSEWFDTALVNPLECTTPYDGDAFQWKWIGPAFPSGYWELWSSEYQAGAFPLVPSQLKGGGLGVNPLAGNWPADTNFDCDLPEGSYYEVTDSAVATQFQV